MKRKVVSYILICLTFIVLTATTCDDSTVYYRDVILLNSIDETIYVEDFMFSDQAELLSPYHVFNLIDLRALKEIPKGSTFIGKFPMLEKADNKMKYQIIIFKQSTLDKYTKEELVENDIFDKRYVLTYEELEAMGFKIVYTGE